DDLEAARADDADEPALHEEIALQSAHDDGHIAVSVEPKADDEAKDGAGRGHVATPRRARRVSCLTTSAPAVGDAPVRFGRSDAPQMGYRFDDDRPQPRDARRSDVGQRREILCDDFL